MQKPYSEGLREKVLKVFDAGEMTIIKKFVKRLTLTKKRCIGGGKGKKRPEVLNLHLGTKKDMFIRLNT